MSIVNKFERNADTWELHNEKIASCGEYYASYTRTKDLFTDRVILPIWCGSNYCEKCRKKNIRKLRDMLYSTIEKHTERWRFLTLTYDPKIKSISDQYKDIAKMWDRFRRRLYRTDDLKNVKWIRSVEKQSSGNLHIHAIVNKFLKKDEIIKHWSELGGGGIDITLNPKCTEHKRKCCTQCYPAQWLHLEECTDHKKIFCRDCFKYLNRCELHKVESCGVCYPSNVFDYNKFAADYLTVELVKSKQHQDPYRTGLNWWMARRRSIAMSRNIKLNKERSDVKFEWEGKLGKRDVVDQWIDVFNKDRNKKVEVFENMIVISDII